MLLLLRSVVQGTFCEAFLDLAQERNNDCLLRFVHVLVCVRVTLEDKGSAT